MMQCIMARLGGIYSVPAPGRAEKIAGQKETSFDFDEIINSGKIFLVKLGKGGGTLLRRDLTRKATLFAAFWAQRSRHAL